MSARDDLIKLLVDEVSRAGVTTVTADLHTVNFLDSSAIYAFLTAHQAAQNYDVSFTVARAHGHVEAVLTITGVLAILTAVSDLGTDRAAPGAGDDTYRSV